MIKPSLTRRFIRTKAVHNLYAFYIASQANYACALDQLHSTFIPNIFANFPEDKTQLAQEKQQALDLFTASFASPQPLQHANLVSYNNRVRDACSKTLASYRQEMAKDMHKLKRDLEKTVGKIDQTCVRILQLLVEWAQIAQKQTERPRLNQQHGGVLTTGLHKNGVLLRLKTDPIFNKIVQEKSAGWQKDIQLIESWYNQFVKHFLSLNYCTDSVSPQQEEQALVQLIENLVFNNEVIQEFFSELDLSWLVHKQIIKKMVCEALYQFSRDPGKNISFTMQTDDMTWEQEQIFYTDLITKALEEEKNLEGLIKSKITKWAVDRIVPLDKTILKLAMCEMLYFNDIPIKVSINEYIELSKIYSTPKSSQFVNGLLDAVAVTLCQTTDSRIN